MQHFFQELFCDWKLGSIAILKVSISHILLLCKILYICIVRMVVVAHNKGRKESSVMRMFSYQSQNQVVNFTWMRIHQMDCIFSVPLISLNNLFKIYLRRPTLAWSIWLWERWWIKILPLTCLEELELAFASISTGTLLSFLEEWLMIF